MASPDVEGAPLPSLGTQQYLPKSRKRTKAGRYSHEITYEELSQHFHLPTEKACQKLGVGLTILKRICRRFGLPRWPYKKPSKLVYGPTPSAYDRQGQADNQNAAASGGILDRPHLADTPAANYLRQQGYGQPSPFTTLPLPTGWQMPVSWPHQQLQSVHMQHQQQQLEGCSRPIPRRIVSSGHKSIPEATMRAIGLSHDTMVSQEAQTDRLDLLISAIDHSENMGGAGEWDGTDINDSHRGGSIKEPSSPASVNTLQGSPTTSSGVPSALRAAGVVRPLSVNHDGGGGMSEHALAAAAAALMGGTNATVSAVHTAPVVLQATPAVPITTSTATAATAATTGATTLTDALAQLTNQHGGSNRTSAEAVQSLVQVMASHPELAQQFRRLLNQPKEPSAFTEQYQLYQQVATQQQQQQQQPLQQQKQHGYVQERSAAAINAGALNEHDLLIHLLQQRQQQQQQQQVEAAAPAAAAALRRAQLSAKFQVLQTKLAGRLAALQKLQNHMEMQNVMADQHQQNPRMALPPATGPTAAAAAAATTGGIGGSANAFSAATADVSGTTNAHGGANAGQNERREALFRLLAAKLQNHQQQQQQQSFA